MTLISDIIQQAYRESNLIAVGASPTAAEEAEALKRLNSIFKSTLGYEVGETLRDVNLGKAEIVKQEPSNVGWVDSAPSWWWNNNVLQSNVRMVVQIDEPTDVYLSPLPEDGARFALSDPFSLLSTYPVTIYGNGRLIDGASSAVFNTSDVDIEWIYRADLSAWVQVDPLTDTSSEMPFPEKFDDYWIIELAMRLNPRYGRSLAPESLQAHSRIKSKLEARYRQTRQVPSELGLWYPSWWGAGSFVTGKI